MPHTWADRQTLDAVRPKVREILEASEGYNKLAPEERKDLAMKMVKVAAYLANPEGVATQGPPAPAPAPKRAISRAQADGVEGVKDRLAKDPGFAGKDFKAGAIAAGTEQFGALVQKVDFPKFVAGLIDGVFKSIVDSSIAQMRAYSELLANVAKTVDQFAQDNISMNNSRDWLAQKFPDKLGVDTSGADTGFAADTPAGATDQGSPKLVVKADDAEAALKEISDELKLLEARHRPLRRGRGTAAGDRGPAPDGPRPAADARLDGRPGHQPDRRDRRPHPRQGRLRHEGLRHRQARPAPRCTTGRKTPARRAPASVTAVGSRRSRRRTTRASRPITSPRCSRRSTRPRESKAQVKANLTGEVRVNFKSDYFPMEKLANPQMIAAIQGNAVPPEHKAAPAPAPAAAKA